MVALSQEPVSGETAEPTIEMILDGLNNPCGVAIQPDTGDVFVSESGAGRILRVRDGKAEAVITDFPKDVYGNGPQYKIGPLGLLFLNRDALVVGGGGLPDGEELVRIYRTPEVGNEAIPAGKTRETAGPLGKTDGAPGEGNFYALAANDISVFVTANGDDEKGWIAKSGRGPKLSQLKRFIATKTATGVDAPVGITISPEGFLVVGQMGEITSPGDSVLTFYNAGDGRLLLNLETGLNDIVSVAYSPVTGLLYTLDFSWMSPQEGGLFRLDKDRTKRTEAIATQKITALDKPTSMAFANDGELYVTVFGVTVFGAGKDGDEKPSGKLLKITGKKPF